MRQSKIFLSVLLAFIFISAASALADTLNLLGNPGFENKSIVTWSAMDSCRFELNNLAHIQENVRLLFILTKQATESAPIFLRSLFNEGNFHDKRTQPNFCPLV